MAKRADLFFYEVLMVVDLPFWGLNKREAHKMEKGKITIPERIAHNVRVLPSAGFDRFGKPLLPDYVAFDRPVGRHYTEEMEKMVDRKKLDRDGRSIGREMRPKTTKVKLRLLENWEITETVRARAIYKGDKWREDIFEDCTEDVVLSKEMKALDEHGVRLRKMESK